MRTPFLQSTSGWLLSKFSFLIYSDFQLKKSRNCTESTFNIITGLRPITLLKRDSREIIAKLLRTLSSQNVCERHFSKIMFVWIKLNNNWHNLTYSDYFCYIIFIRKCKKKKRQFVKNITSLVKLVFSTE